MNRQLDGLPMKRTHFLAIPHSKSMYDLPRQEIPPCRTCVTAAYRLAYAYPTRPVSFCPIFAPGSSQGPDSSSTNNRRLSELPAQLDLGLPFGCLLEGDNFSSTKGHSPDLNSTEALPNLHYRYGTSSTSGPSEKAVLSFENSSSTSSACTAPTSPIDSDRASSIHGCGALDFPEPPPIGSPVIRRMRSSPWFLSADEVDGVLAVPGRAALHHLRRQSHICSTGFKAESMKPRQNSFGYPKENPLGFCDGGTIETHDTRLDDGHMKATQSETYLRQDKFQSGEKNDNSKAVPRTESSSTPFGRLPRIIRKVASMRSDSHRTQESADAPNRSTVTFQRPVPRVRSFLSILPGSEPPRTNFKQDPWQSNKRNFFWTGQTIQTSKTKTEVNAEKHKRRCQLTSHVVYEKNRATSSTALGLSLQHGTSWKEDFNKSFINISPDRPKGRRKERIKSLLSKANELFSWGRSQRKMDLQQGGRHR